MDHAHGLMALLPYRPYIIRIATLRAVTATARIFLTGNIREILVRNAIALGVLAVWLAGCAGNQTTQSADSATDSAPAKKKECTYERNTGGTSRMQRVCRYVDAG